MPNHVTTRCVVVGPEPALAAFIGAHIRQDECMSNGIMHLDFESVIPMPQSVRNVDLSNFTAEGYEALTGLPYPGQLFGGSSLTLQHWRDRGVRTAAELKAWLEEHNPAALELGAQAVAAMEATGFPDWHSWSLEHHGTKWNSYHYAEIARAPGRFEFRFDTAWSFPTPVFEALAARHSTLIFDCRTVDEGGAFAGRGQFNGCGDFCFYEAEDSDFEAIFGRTEPQNSDAEGVGAASA